MKVKLIEHNDTAWVRKVDITHKGNTYRVVIGWDKYDGYQMFDGWDELPEALRKEYEDEYGLVYAIDEMTEEAGK